MSKGRWSSTKEPAPFPPPPARGRVPESLMASAQRPEDIFGRDPSKAPAEYRRLAKLCHPDIAGGDGRLFQDLSKWWAKAQERIDRGIYGTAEPSVMATIKTRKREYEILRQIAKGEIANVYLCRWSGEQGILKVLRNPRDNDMMAREAESLTLFGAAPLRYVPRLVEKMVYQGPDKVRRPTHVLGLETDFPGNWRTLRQVREAYPKGLDPQDMAWMWRRLLDALWNVHSKGRVHGAIGLDHVLIHPSMHGLTLVGWGCSGQVGDPIRVTSTTTMLPPRAEVMVPGLDLWMAADSMGVLLMGAEVPKSIRAYLRGCRPLHPKHWPDDAGILLEEFDHIIEDLYGPRRFRPFVMP